MCVGDIMNSPVHTVDMDDWLSTVKTIFDRARCHHVVVLDRSRVFGVVSDRDILRVVSPFVGNPLMERPQDVGTTRRRVHQIMSRKPTTITPDQPVAVAAARMLGERVSSLPVVDDDDALVGIVTTRDILTWAVNNNPAPPAG
ncbi:MAG: CBS domain-containing protein [Phycisphaerales bacterium]|nr:CBS domain-containing protein [Phycisphaerales bacterium]